MPATKPNPDKVMGNGVSKKEQSALDRMGPRFVRCDLSKPQKEQLQMFADEGETVDMLEWLYSRVTGGHVVSIRSLEVGYQCSITGMTEASGHVNQCLVARASTPERALTSAWFKDTVVLTDGWPVSTGLEGLDF